MGYEEPPDEEEPPAAPAPAVAVAIAAAAEAIGVQRAGGGANDEWLKVPCRVCGEQTTVLKAIYEAVKLFNRNEEKLGREAEQGGLFHKPNYISKSQIVACDGECTLKERARISHEAAVDRTTTDHYLETIKTGHLTPDGAGWLRRHGYAQQVQDYYSASPATTGFTP